MRYSNNGKINVPLYLLGGGLLVLATSLVLYLVNKTVNVGFIILGVILVLFSGIAYLFSNKREKKPYYEEKAKKKYGKDKSDY